MKVEPYRFTCALCQENHTATTVFVLQGKTLRANICDPCAIRWDWRAAKNRNDKERLVAEFARYHGISMDGARSFIQMDFKNPQFSEANLTAEVL
jgi:protein-arginine kinase activator protein McsA